MSQRKLNSRTLAARFDGLTRSPNGRLAAGGIAFLLIGVVCLMDDATAAAARAGPLALGGLLGGLLAVKRSSNPSTRCLSELRRVRVRPLHSVDRNRR